MDPILRKHKVDIYACWHIHNFQHLCVPGGDIGYVVNSAGSLRRKVKPVEGAQFCSPEPGFSIFTTGKKELDMRMIDKKGKVIYPVETHEMRYGQENDLSREWDRLKFAPVPILFFVCR